MIFGISLFAFMQERENVCECECECECEDVCEVERERREREREREVEREKTGCVMTCVVVCEDVSVHYCLCCFWYSFHQPTKRSEQGRFKRRNGIVRRNNRWLEQVETQQAKHKTRANHHSAQCRWAQPHHPHHHQRCFVCVGSLFSSSLSRFVTIAVCFSCFVHPNKGRVSFSCLLTRLWLLCRRTREDEWGLRRLHHLS